MSIKTLARASVEVHAASPRLAEAVVNAAKQVRYLKRFARMVQVRRGATSGPISDNARSLVRLVIAHADDNVLASSRSKSAGEEFHMLLAAPTTHPDQIARWMRMTTVRSERRLHVARIDDLGGPAFAQLLGRLALAFDRDREPGAIIDAFLADDHLIARGPKFRLLRAPLRNIPSLATQSAAARRHFEIDPDGSFLHWPDLDVHLGWSQLLQAVDPNAALKARQRMEGYNQRYGAAIRQVRERMGLPQTRIAGLTERQLRRIERGECRATRAALDALAAAHGLDANAYMDQLAKAMT